MDRTRPGLPVDSGRAGTRGPRSTAPRRYSGSRFVSGSLRSHRPANAPRSAPMQGPDVELEALPTAPIYELATFRPSFQDELPAHWPQGPGDARRSADGSAEILKIAADRWLLLQPRSDVVATAAALSRACALLDVTGKWREFRLRGASAVRL